MKMRKFISKNGSLLVLIPVIIGGHYGWYKLQMRDELVTDKERKNLPFAKTLFKEEV